MEVFGDVMWKKNDFEFDVKTAFASVFVKLTFIPIFFLHNQLISLFDINRAL